MNLSRFMMDAMKEIDNVWADLLVPLSDLYLHEVAPKYLTSKDLANLSAVSRRYRDFFAPKTVQGRKLLVEHLRREAKHHPKNAVAADAHLYYCDVLPSVGTLSAEESLEKHPLLVAQLRHSASRRRRLVRLHYLLSDVPDTRQQEALQTELRQILLEFKPKRWSEIRRFQRLHHLANRPRAATEFVCVNLSGVDIHCHWIDRDGEILLRDGDVIPHAPASLKCQPSFVVTQADGLPRHVFRHRSYVYHAFALCFEPGGPPFAIYQQRRCWFRVRGTQHTHAIAVRPGGVIEELHCESSHRVRNQSMPCIYKLFDRNSGALVSEENATATDACADTVQELSGGGNLNGGEEQQHTLERAASLAKTFYGQNVPPVYNRCWHEGISEIVRLLGGPVPVNFLNPLGEAMSGANTASWEPLVGE